MGKVSGSWLTGVHSGSACRHEDIYTKVNKKTGACYSVKLCNPNTESNENQVKTQGAFKLVSRAVNAWVKAEREANSADYKKLEKLFKQQSKFSTMRGMIIGKGMYTVSGDSVTIDLEARTNFKAAFSIANAEEGGAGASVTKYKLTVNMSPAGSGSVTFSPTSADGKYAAGTVVTMTAVPASGKSFDSWSDDSTGVMPATRTITMDGDKTVTAYFG